MYIKTTSISPLGSVVFVWYMIHNKPRIVHIILPSNDYTARDLAGLLYPSAVRKTCSVIETAVDDVKASIQGKPVRLSVNILLLESLPPFEQKVLRVVKNIPRGKVSSYKFVAEKAGRPGAARAVGNAMAKNPFPLIVPCHRVLNSNGNPGGFQCGTAIKQCLLRNEGIEFNQNNLWKNGRFYYS